jgi:hypothetical protein
VGLDVWSYFKNKVISCIIYRLSKPKNLEKIHSKNRFVYGSRSWAVTSPNYTSRCDVAVFDTIAGFETMVNVSGVSADDDLKLILYGPNGSKDTIDLNYNGRRWVSDIEKQFVERAGEYRGKVISMNSRQIIKSVNFVVFPGDPSIEKTRIVTDVKTITADGKAQARVRVALRDEFSNPIKGHLISLLSHRAYDRIKAVRKDRLTDERGYVDFYISSKNPGISTLTAVDTTLDITFDDRLEINFAASVNVSDFGLASILSIGGDDVVNSSRFVAQASRPKLHLEIEGIEDAVEINENLSFTLRVIDEDGFLASDYLGTVIFDTPQDSNAVIPSEYTFNASDRGEHIFDLSLSFKTSGLQSFDVFDSEDVKIEGSVQIDVREPRGSASNIDVLITKPAPGSYGVDVLTIEGDAPENSDVTIFDNGLQIGITRAASTGRFSFTTPRLEDGVHRFSVEADNLLSQEVEVSIDATGSDIKDVSISPPHNIPAGSSVTITVRAEPGLENVSATVNGLIVDLAENAFESGVYEVVITAPEMPGVYPVDIILLDSLGNESFFGEAASNNVTFFVPSKVGGVRAISTEQGVKLTWDAANDDTGISHYRIFYGINRDDLQIIIDTFDARTEWEVRNLSSGVQYFFQIYGVDTQGNQGHQGSAIVSMLSGGDGNEADAVEVGGFVGSLDSEVVTVPITLPNDGPGVGLLLASPGIAYLIRRRSRKKK